MIKDKSVKFVTLGCKVNQYETQGIRESLLGRGLEEGGRQDSGCDYVVINTCTVTSEADRENRYWIRRMRRENPEATIVVTGCYVERNRKEVEELPGVDLVVSNHDKDEIADRLLSGCGSPENQDAELRRQKRRRFTPLSISSFQGRGRAFIKIQDGCNHSCAFCKVVLVRGRSRSRDLAGIVEEARRLRDSGYREVVLAGIQLGAYGLDLGRTEALSEVIEALAPIDGLERIRLSSIEPTDVTDGLIRTLRDIPKCCPHLHIPLQSGDDAVLAGMNRRHGAAFYKELVMKLKEELPGFSLSLDVMAGFPGETAGRFENTANLLKEVRPLKCHVFPYSKREGTRAAKASEEEVSRDVIRSRVQELIRLADELGSRERLAYQGKTLPVLVEKKLKRGGLVQGLTKNYIKVCFQADESSIGQVVDVELLSLEGDVFLGRPLRH